LKIFIKDSRRVLLNNQIGLQLLYYRSGGLLSGGISRLASSGSALDTKIKAIRRLKKHPSFSSLKYPENLMRQYIVNMFDNERLLRAPRLTLYNMNKMIDLLAACVLLYDEPYFSKTASSSKSFTYIYKLIRSIFVFAKRNKGRLGKGFHALRRKNYKGIISESILINKFGRTAPGIKDLFDRLIFVR